MNEASSLVVVGTGIKFMSHLTTEAKVYIQKSDKVLYLVNEPAMKEWIQQNNIHTESLDEFYNKYPLRINCYRAITAYILENLHQGGHICVVLYGHPSVFAKPGLDAVIEAKKQGYYAKILPGISAESCLFADLLIDPGTYGCQSFEATDFLLRKRRIDHRSYLILWQVGVIGVLDRPEFHDNTVGATLLVNYLNEYYSLEHEIFLYEAAQYPGFEAKIEKFKLGELMHAKFSSLSTLCIPPLAQPSIDENMAKNLNLNIENIPRNKVD